MLELIYKKSKCKCGNVFNVETAEEIIKRNHLCDICLSKKNVKRTKRKRDHKVPKHYVCGHCNTPIKAHAFRCKKCHTYEPTKVEKDKDA